MGVAIYPIFEGSSEGWPDDMNGKCLARASDQLDRVAQAAKVPSLFDFYSMTPEEAGEEIGEKWFEPLDGLRTVRALLDYVRNDGRKIEQLDDVRDDLAAFEQHLIGAAAKNVRWHLVVDA
jgi:hypothetical protein